MPSPQALTDTSLTQTQLCRAPCQVAPGSGLTCGQDRRKRPRAVPDRSPEPDRPALLFPNDGNCKASDSDIGFQRVAWNSPLLSALV